MRLAIPLLALPLLSACTSLVPTAGEADSSTNGDATSSSMDPVATTHRPDPTVDPTVAVTTDGPEPGSTSTPIIPDTTGGGDSTGETDETCNFLDCSAPDVPPPSECSTWDQDCPKGEKCNPWANDGGSSWNSLRCVPVDPDPDGVDDPCTVEGSPTSGLDSCEFGAMCWDVDPDTLVGTCVPLCIGDPSTPLCADPGRWCIATAESVLNLCLSECDPLDPMACPEGQGCYPSNGAFICAPDASGDAGGVFEPCRFINTCDPGFECAPSDVSIACEGPRGCCVPYCSLQAPNCPAPTTCVPYFEGMAPPAHEDLGVCIDG